MDGVLHHRFSRIIINHLYHHVFRAKNIHDVVSSWKFLLGIGRKIENLLFSYGNGVINLEAIEVEVLFSIIELIALVEDLPCDVPVNLLSGVLILLLAHGLCSGILVPSWVLKLNIEILVHWVSLLLVSLHHSCVPMLHQTSLVEFVQSTLRSLDIDVESIVSKILSLVHRLPDHSLSPESLWLIVWSSLNLTLALDLVFLFSSRKI